MTEAGGKTRWLRSSVGKGAPQDDRRFSSMATESTETWTASRMA
jgi:hypothetical protein